MRTSTKALIAMAVITAMVIGCSIIFVVANWVMYRNTTPAAEASGSYTAPTAPPSLSGEIEEPCSQPGATRQTERGVEVCSPTEKWVLIPNSAPNPTNNNKPKGAWIQFCAAEPEDPSITKLVENGKVVPNAFMALDKNEAEVAASDFWLLEVPTGSYTHAFVPNTGLTYEIVGPAHMVVGAATVWCQAGAYAPAEYMGMARVKNAKDLTTPLIDEWMVIPESGILPVPGFAETSPEPTLPHTANSTPAPAPTQTGAPCPPPTENGGWTWQTEGHWFRDDPDQISFVVPPHIRRVDYYNGVSHETHMEVPSGALVDGASTATAWCKH